jgi:peptide/nickel transport system permease protein
MRVRRLADKVVMLLATLLAVSFGSFMLTAFLPGDPAALMLGQSGVTPQAIAAVRKELGLNRPVLERYWIWLGHVVHGDLGFSYASNENVRSMIWSHLPVTLEIIILSMLISLVIAVPLGVWNGHRAGHVSDQITAGITFVLLAVPSFVLALLLILLFAVHLHLFPASGWVPLTQNPWENLRSAMLPALALALPQVAIFARLLRGDMVTTLHEDFITLAHAKGLSTPRVLIVHAFRPSSFSLVTVIGLQVGFLLGGTVIVENLFSLPGIGSMLVSAINSRDLVTVQALTLFIGASFVIINFAVDVIYSTLDPRIRRGHALAG